MRTELGSIFVILLIVGLMAVLTPAVASAAGSGPDDAMAPSGEMIPIEPGETHWYVFREEGDGSQIDIEMEVDPASGASFEVWTKDTLRLWQQGLDFEPVGRGTANPNIDADYNWSGNFVESGNFYVLVNHEGTGTSFYKLSITGKDVSFPTRTAPVAEAAPAPMARAMAPTEEPTMAAGIGIYAVDGVWRTLGMNDIHWYAFNYGGDNSPIQIAVDEEVDGRVNFAVWTPELYARKMKGEDVEPIGRGSPDPCVQMGNLNWAGSFDFGGRFYVSVDHTCQEGPGTYVLQVMGADVSTQ